MKRHARNALILLLAGHLQLNLAAPLARPQQQGNTALWRSADYLLLGEIHDNGTGHALRLHWLKLLVQQRQVVLAFEQFDRQDQEALDDAIQQWRYSGRPPNGNQAKQIAEAARFNFKGWKWSLYEPVVEMAMRQKIPLAAANLSHQEMVNILKGISRPQLPEVGVWGPERQAAMEALVREGHCNLLPESQVPMMAEAEKARDYEMAEVLVGLHKRTGKQVILIAGNGHIRKDLAVPVWLRHLDPDARIMSIAVIEKGDKDENGVYDNNYEVTAQPRPDPCKALELRIRKLSPGAR
jgi:uncharacterized iron-regulated protein